MERLKALLAPAALGRLKALFRCGNHYTGDYTSWESALRDSTGYDAAEILERVRLAVNEVREGRAACERDSVLFAEPQLSFPILAGMLRAATASAGRLAVLDFGGSLGSSYYQCRQFLNLVRHLSWSVVEQEAFVTCGRQDLQVNGLRFDFTIDEAFAAIHPNVALLSSVLQYVPDPYAILRRLDELKIENILVDRLVCSAEARDHIAVQHVPASIYRATYPIRIFAKDAVECALGANYSVVARFDCVWDGSHIEYCGGLAFGSKGLILQRKAMK